RAPFPESARSRFSADGWIAEPAELAEPGFPADRRLAERPQFEFLAGLGFDPRASRPVGVGETAPTSRAGSRRGAGPSRDRRPGNHVGADPRRGRTQPGPTGRAGLPVV